MWRAHNLHRDKMKTLKNQMRTVRMKTKQQTKELACLACDSATELFPSVADILLWTETLCALVDQDYQSRQLLTEVLISAKHISEFCGAWSSSKSIADFRAGKKYEAVTSTRNTCHCNSTRRHANSCLLFCWANWGWVWNALIPSTITTSHLTISTTSRTNTLKECCYYFAVNSFLWCFRCWSLQPILTSTHRRQWMT